VFLVHACSVCVDVWVIMSVRTKSFINGIIKTRKVMETKRKTTDFDRIQIYIIMQYKLLFSEMYKKNCLFQISKMNLIRNSKKKKKTQISRRIIVICT